MRKIAGEWSEHRETGIWHAGTPLEVKFEIEKTTGALLARDAGQTELLTFSGPSSCEPYSFQIRLRFEAAMEDRRLYSLSLDVTGPREWVSKEDARKTADRAFTFWIRNLKTANVTESPEMAPGENYGRLVREALELELQQAGRTEDLAPVQAIQGSILEAMREGASFRTSHHEGGTYVFWDGTRFVREEYGVGESREEYADGKQMLAYVRRLYNSESRRETYPHQPPEVDVWKFIVSRMGLPAPAKRKKVRAIVDHWSRGRTAP